MALFFFLSQFLSPHLSAPQINRSIIFNTAMSQPIYLTKERLKEYEDELNEMTTKGRADIARKIAEARSHGDLKENGDYDAAKEEQGLMELRINKIQNILARARSVDSMDFPNDKIYILSKVKVKNKKNNATLEYMMVSEEEADFEKNKLAVNSPVGRALMGKGVGDVAQVKVPAGLMEYEILEISR
jgi:transcription elongation factor GreA